MMDNNKLTIEEIELQALELMEQHDGDPQGTVDADNKQLQESFQQLCDCRTVLRKQQQPIDVEARLQAFHDRMATESDSHTQRRRHRTVAFAAAALTAAAAVLAFVFLPDRPSAPATAPGTVFVAQKQEPVTVTDGETTNVPRQGKGNRIVLSPEDYALTNAETSRIVLTVPYGRSADITLPDGSIAYVHTGSQLTFAQQTINGARVVKLKGEAYFKVTHDPAHPFVVITGDTQTKVLGTEFDVNTEGKHGTSVTLITGSVEISNANHRQRITPGQQATVSSEGISAQEVDMEPYTNWRDGYLYFDNMGLLEILEAIGKNYNLTVIFNNQQAMHYKTHFIAERNAGIRSVLDMINRMGKVKVRQEGSQLIVD